MAAQDIVFIGIIIFVLGTAFFATHFVMNTVVDKMTTISEINSSNRTLEALQGTKNLTNRMDYVIFGVFIALVLSLIITGWFISGNPIYMFIYFIVVVLGVVAGAVFSWFWTQFSQASIFGTTLLQFPITNHLLTNLPYYLAGVGMLGLIVMFGKPYFQQQ